MGHHKMRTSGMASKMLADYEALNSDLPAQTRRWLGMFLIAPKTGVAALEALFERPLGSTLLRHRSWMWYQTMRHSGLERHWTNVANYHNAGAPMCDILKTVRDLSTKDEWLLFSRRHGIPIFSRDRVVLNPHNYAYKNAGKTIWTKGGTWWKDNNFTKIIVLGENLTRDHNDTYLKFTPSAAKVIERELHNLIDPDDNIFPTAIDRAVEYVRYRMPNIIGRKLKAGYKMVAWFFQTRIPHPHGGFIKNDQTANYPMKCGTDWRWLP